MQLGAYQTNIHHFQSKIYTFFTESMFEKVSFSLVFNWFFTIYKAFLFYFKESELLWRAVSQKEKKNSVSGKLKKKKKTHSFCHRQKKFWPVLLCLLVPWRCWKIHYTHAKFVDFIYLVECIVYTDILDMHQTSNIISSISASAPL